MKSKHPAAGRSANRFTPKASAAGATMHNSRIRCAKPSLVIGVANAKRELLRRITRDAESGMVFLCLVRIAVGYIDGIAVDFQPFEPAARHTVGEVQILPRAPETKIGTELFRVALGGIQAVV